MGSIFVTLNGVLLGANISYLQTVCILGYCLFPLVFIGVIITIMKHANSDIPRFVYIILACVSFIWASICKINNINFFK